MQSQGICTAPVSMYTEDRVRSDGPDMTTDDKNRAADASVLDELAKVIAARRAASADTSYTASLLAEGVERCAQKFGEESVEFVIAAATGDLSKVKAEGADVLYHLLVALEAAGVAPSDIYAVLEARAGRSGLAEKASRNAR